MLYSSMLVRFCVSCPCFFYWVIASVNLSRVLSPCGGSPGNSKTAPRSIPAGRGRVSEESHREERGPSLLQYQGKENDMAAREITVLWFIRLRDFVKFAGGGGEGMEVSPVALR